MAILSLCLKTKFIIDFMKTGEKKGEETVTFEEEEQPLNKPLIFIIILILVLVVLVFIASKPDLLSPIFQLFVWENPNTCYIDSELKTFIRSQAEVYRRDSLSGSIEPSFVINYNNVAGYQICYIGNYLCRKSGGDKLYCSSISMPFEVFCFKKSVSTPNGTQEIITCVKSFEINNRTLEVTSLACEPAPGVVQTLC